MPKQKQEEYCNKASHDALEAARRGDVASVKQYLDNGGDPLLECFAVPLDKETTMHGYRRLYTQVEISGDLELLKCYLTYNIPNEIKDKMLEHFLAMRYSDHVKLLIANDAHSNIMACCHLPVCLEQLRMLDSLNYDLNWVDPETGENLLMEYAGCPSEKHQDALLDIIKYLVEQGVRTDLKNNKGEALVDIAVNEKIKAYFQSLE